MSTGSNRIQLGARFYALMTLISLAAIGLMFGFGFLLDWLAHRFA